MNLDTRSRNRNRSLRSFVVAWLTVCIALLPAAPACAQWGDEWLDEVMPSRPRIDTRWEPLPLPVSEMELLESAKRLGLSREQTIAFESLLPAYQQQANEARKRGNFALAAIDTSQWSNVREAPPMDEINKVQHARQAFGRELDRLDSGLFDGLGPMLNETQQAALVRERLRRDRRRMQSDGAMAGWSSRQKLLVELGDVVDGLNLPAEQRDAALALVVEFESQATQRMRKLNDSITDMPKEWAAAIKPQEHSYMAISTVASSRIEQIREMIDMELQWRDRIANVLQPEQAAAFRMAHASEQGVSGGWRDTDYLRALGDAIAKTEGIDPAVKQQIAQDLAKAIASQNEIFPEIAELERRVNTGQMVRFLGQPMGMMQNDYERMRPMYERMNELQQKFWEGYATVQQSLPTLLGEERMAIVQTEVSKARSARPEYQYRDGNSFGDRNSVTLVSMHGGGLDIAVPMSAPRCGSKGLAALGVNADEQSIALDLLAAHAERWGEQCDALGTKANSLMQMWHQQDQAFDLDGHIRQSDEVMQAARSLQSLEAGPDAELQAVIGDERLATRVIAAQRWVAASTAPRNCPAPMNIVRTSHYRTMISRLDRVDPMATLLALNAPPEAIEAAWQVLIDAAPPATERLWRLRLAVVNAYLVSNRAMAWQQSEMRRNQDNGGRNMDWKVYQSLQTAGNDACIEAQKARLENIEALASLHDQIAATLEEPWRSRYVEAVSRGAFPDAWSGLDKADALADRALALPDLSEAQRQQVQDAWIGHQAMMREQALALERLIDAYVKADDMTPNAARQCAPVYGELEQAMFERVEATDAMWRLLRPILTPEQTRNLEPPSPT